MSSREDEDNTDGEEEAEKGVREVPVCAIRNGRRARARKAPLVQRREGGKEPYQNTFEQDSYVQPCGPDPKFHRACTCRAVLRCH